MSRKPKALERSGRSLQTEMRKRFKLTARQARFVFLQVTHPERKAAENYRRAKYKTNWSACSKLQRLAKVEAAAKWLRSELKTEERKEAEEARAIDHREALKARLMAQANAKIGRFAKAEPKPFDRELALAVLSDFRISNAAAEEVLRRMLFNVTLTPTDELTDEEQLCVKSYRQTKAGTLEIVMEPRQGADRLLMDLEGWSRRDETDQRLADSLRQFAAMLYAVAVGELGEEPAEKLKAAMAEKLAPE